MRVARLYPAARGERLRQHAAWRAPVSPFVVPVEIDTVLHSISMADPDGAIDVVLAALAGQPVERTTPAVALSHAISGHAVSRPSADAPADAPQHDRVVSRLPGAASVRIVQAEDGGGGAIGNHRYARLPSIALVGPTSRAPVFTHTPALTVDVALTPAGWNAVAGVAANKLANRITPLAQVSPDLHARIAAAVPGLVVDTVVPALEAIFADLGMRTRHHEADSVRALDAAVGRGATTNVGELAGQMAMTEAQLRRMAMRHFGFPPKLLVMRARFCQAFAQWLSSPDIGADAISDHGYFDASHFLRDAAKFLGTTPRRYVDRLMAS